MISSTSVPSKYELVRKIRLLRNPTIEVIEVFQKSDKTLVMKIFERMVNKGHFSIIIVKE